MIFEEHFGLGPNDSVDYMNENVWKDFISRAAKNTQIFRNVFACIPDDIVSKLTEIDGFQEKHGDISAWFTDSANIKGHVVTFPLNFLNKEDLTFKATDKEFFAPDITFT
jgi:phospholipase D1/2